MGLRVGPNRLHAAILEVGMDITRLSNNWEWMKLPGYGHLSVLGSHVQL